MTRPNDDRIDEMVQEVFSTTLGAKRLLEVLLERIMEGELTEHLGAERHERSDSRRGYRNGSKRRTLKTRVGELQFQVPQGRGCEPYHPSFFARFQRSERALLAACAEMYFQGVSTRKVRAVLETMGGLDLSASTVSRVAAEVDEKLAAFRSQRLDAQAYRYLIVDARYEKVRVNGRVVSQAVMVVAGVNGAGRREILDWQLGDSESESTWSEVFEDLKKRGLHGVLMVTSDAHAGIRAAMAKHLQGVAWQRCRVHFMREMCGKVSHRCREQLMRELADVWRPEERVACLRLGQQMADRWEAKYPKVARMLRDGLEDCLTVCELPSEHRRRLHSTNMLERIMRELKRRTAVVGVFPSVASCDRLIGAQLVELDEKWQTEKMRYLNMEHLTRQENPPTLKPLAEAG